MAGQMRCDAHRSLKVVEPCKTLSNRYKASGVISLGMFMTAPVARWVLYLWFRLPADSSS